MTYSISDKKKKAKVLLGTVDGEKIYLTRPTFDCDWYWSFGYLGNRDQHYHLDGISGQNQNLYDAIISHFDDGSFVLDCKDLWTFCELAQTAYALKNTAEVLGRGGYHYTTNPVKEIIINTTEVERINTVVLPAVFSAIDELFSK